MANSDGKGAVGREIATAAGAAIDAAADLAGADPEQLDMLAPPTRASLSGHQQERVDAAIKHDRRGRPPGARNKTTREMLEFVRKTMGDPLLTRFRWATHTPETLAIELGCSKLEAFDRLDRMWGELSKLFYAQLAAVDGAGNAVVPRFTMVVGGQNAAAPGPSGEPRPPWEYVLTLNAENQQNQALLEPAGAVSHGRVSHGDE